MAFDAASSQRPTHFAAGTGLKQDECDSLPSRGTSSPLSKTARKDVHGRWKPAAAENCLSRRVSEFFRSISAKNRQYKSGRRLANLAKQEKQATVEISDGFKRDNFKKVCQGLKRLEKTAIEREKRTDKGHFDKEDYVKPIFLVILPDIFFERYRDSTSISLKFLSDDDEMRRKMVSEHSDRTKFFHRMLETLKKVHLISSSYINARTARIDAMDEKITEALKKLYATADNLQSNIEKVCDERSPFKDKIQAFDKLRTEDTSKGKRKYSKKETDNSVVYEILDKKRGKSITKFELGKVDIHTIDKSIKKEIEENFEKLVVSVRNAKHDPSNKFDFDKDYDRGYNEALFLNGEHLILENSKDIENKFAPNDADILRGFCQQGLYEALLRKIAVCIFGEEKRKFEIFTDSRGRLSRIEYSMEYDTSKSTEEAYNKLKDNAENNPLDDKTEVVKSVQANAVIGVENGIVTLNYFDCTFERF